MFFQKLIKIINIIFSSNLDFFPPKKNKILIFDRNGSKIIFKYIDKKIVASCLQEMKVLICI